MNRRTRFHRFRQLFQRIGYLDAVFLCPQQHDEEIGIGDRHVVSEKISVGRRLVLGEELKTLRYRVLRRLFFLRSGVGAEQRLEGFVNLARDKRQHFEQAILSVFAGAASVG